MIETNETLNTKEILLWNLTSNFLNFIVKIRIAIRRRFWTSSIKDISPLKVLPPYEICIKSNWDSIKKIIIMPKSDK